MISLELATLLERLTAVLWPFLRISAFLLAAPFFSLDVVNVRVRIAMGVVLTVFTANLVDLPSIDPFSVDGLLQVFLQIYIGVLLGLALQVVSAAVIVAGQVIANAMGLGFASMVDPGLGNMPVVSQWLLIIATLLFFSVDGHLFVIELLVLSFQRLPVGAMPDLAQWFEVMLAWSPYIFAAGLNLALPMMVALLVVNTGLGIITRSAPALNIISVGFPAILLAGFLMLNLALPGILRAMDGLWSESFTVMESLLEVGSGR